MHTRTCMHICTHVRAQLHTHTHQHTHTQIHTNIRTDTQTRTKSHSYAHVLHSLNNSRNNSGISDKSRPLLPSAICGHATPNTQNKQNLPNETLTLQAVLSQRISVNFPGNSPRSHLFLTSFQTVREHDHVPCEIAMQKGFFI